MNRPSREGDSRLPSQVAKGVVFESEPKISLMAAALITPRRFGKGGIRVSSRSTVQPPDIFQAPLLKETILGLGECREVKKQKVKAQVSEGMIVYAEQKNHKEHGAYIVHCPFSLEKTIINKDIPSPRKGWTEFFKETVEVSEKTTWALNFLNYLEGIPNDGSIIWEFQVIVVTYERERVFEEQVSTQIREKLSLIHI